jgi:type IV secretion system protein VirD4
MLNRCYALQAMTAAGLALICLWAATQWAAQMLGYQPALGSPVFTLAGLRIYAPWQLFSWWLSFENQAPDVSREPVPLQPSGDWRAAR